MNKIEIKIWEDLKNICTNYNYVFNFDTFTKNNKGK